MVTTVEVFERQSLMTTTVLLRSTLILTSRPNGKKFTYLSGKSL